LTAQAVAPFITGPNMVLGLSGGPEMWSILKPSPRIS
jgi:hypothetical protein